MEPEFPQGIEWTVCALLSQETFAAVVKVSARVQEELNAHGGTGWQADLTEGQSGQVWRSAVLGR